MTNSTCCTVTQSPFVITSFPLRKVKIRWVFPEYARIHKFPMFCRFSRVISIVIQVYQPSLSIADGVNCECDERRDSYTWQMLTTMLNSCRKSSHLSRVPDAMPNSHSVRGPFSAPSSTANDSINHSNKHSNRTTGTITTDFFQMDKKLGYYKISQSRQMLTNFS